MKPGRSKKPELTFETAMTELEEVVAAMEEGQLPLDELLKRYEDGMSLVKFCAERLARAEKQVEVLGSELDKTLAVNGEVKKGGAKVIGKKKVTIAEEEIISEEPLKAEASEDEFSF